MRVAVDIDGVLYDWEGTARMMLRRYLEETGKPPLDGLNRVSTHWTYIEELVGNEAWEWLWSYGVEQGLFRNGHIIKGGLDGLRELCNRHDVVLVTSRPKNALMDTLEWVSFMLRGCAISGVHVLHGGEEKTGLPWDVLVDDGDHNIEAAVTAGREAVIFKQPWTKQDADGHTTVAVTNWKELLEAL